MDSLRKKLAIAFEHWAVFVMRYDRWVLLAALLLTAAFATRLPDLTIETDIESFLYKDDPAMVVYNNFRDQFGRDDRIVIGIAARDVFTPAFLSRLRDLHHAIEERVPHLEAVDSLINARHVYGTEDELVVEDLFEHWPQSDAEFARLRKIALANPLYRNFLLSADGDFTDITIKLRRYGETLSDEEALLQFDDTAPAGHPAGADAPRKLTNEQNDEVMATLLELLKQYDTEGFRIYAAGAPMLDYTIQAELMHDMQFFVIVGIAMITLLLYLLFHTLTAVIPPLIVVIFALISTLGIMSLADVPMQVPTQILPSFLLAVGIAASVHLLTIFHQQLQKGETKPEALRHAMGHAAQPILFTSLTTAGGLFSFIGSELAPVSHLGVFAPIGVMLSLVYSITLLPALISLLPSPAARESREFRIAGDLLTRVGLIGMRNPVPVMAGTVLLTVAAGYLTTRINFSHNPLNWLPDASPLKVATLRIDKEMAGTMSMEILVDTGTPGAFKDPAALRRMEAMGDEIKGLDRFSVMSRQNISIVDLLKEINQALNANRADAYRLADTREMISQELLLFENSGSDDLADLVDSTYSKARMTLLANWFDAREYVNFVAAAQKIAGQHFPSSHVTVTGLLPILTNTLLILIRSISTSYVLALIIIVPLMMIMVNSAKVGSLAMVPNILPILLCLGVMGAFHIPFDGFTMMIGGVAIGLVVDDTIHFLHHFKRYLDATGSVEEAVLRTLQSTGRAMLFTSVVLVAGFLAFTLSSMHNLINFGALTALAIVLALVADILLMPALVRMLYGKKESISDTVWESQP